MQIYFAKLWKKQFYYDFSNIKKSIKLLDQRFRLVLKKINVLLNFVKYLMFTRVLKKRKFSNF